ncbi:MAG TPA: hypothetical protein PLD10_23395 [Rhodopila sp.]|nr:hypothetical protein [Rhodopila sp.]
MGCEGRLGRYARCRPPARTRRRARAAGRGDPGADGAAVHAYLHRKEPDAANARYWYNRAGLSPETGSLDAEWDALAARLLVG